MASPVRKLVVSLAGVVDVLPCFSFYCQCREESWNCIDTGGRRAGKASPGLEHLTLQR